MKKHFLGLFLLAACLSGPVLTPEPTQAATRIAVVVNDKAITSYDLSQRSKLITLTTRAPKSVANRRAREELIEEALKLQEADRIGIKVTDKQVDEAFASIARRVKLSPSQFRQALGQSGVNSKTLKDRLRAEISWQDIVMRRFRATVRINESDVIAALQGSQKGASNTAIEYDLQQIIFVVPGNASASYKRSRQKEIQKLRSRFTSCREGLRIANGLKEVVVKPVGRKLENELQPSTLKELEKISVGRLTPAKKSPSGFAMLALCDKSRIQTDAVARAEMEGELRNREGQQLSRRYLRDLRSNAIIEER
ncbi:SurA N-terminal domain-containing protein [Flexibacterium corallicola]|uniref:SurA N-terminal domain-containing protein n=1 Tax=Flexibacterium corallicola TaxID=3037259 RepID=UPI00286F4550|nr:SurA N-terminal domain-containing protein [Pseudovibrio sp. M1P-2-3]